MPWLNRCQTSASFEHLPTFQERNTRASIDEAWRRLDMSNLRRVGQGACGLPQHGIRQSYGDDWNETCQQCGQVSFKAPLPFCDFGRRHHWSGGSGTRGRVFSRVVTEVGHEIVGAHLHIHPMEGLEKIKAAHRGGCFRMDGALRGVGGCPMAQDDLVGNAPTEWIVDGLGNQGFGSLSASSFGSGLVFGDRLVAIVCAPRRAFSSTRRTSN